MELNNQMENKSVSVEKKPLAGKASPPLKTASHKEPKKSKNLKINFKTLLNWLIFLFILLGVAFIVYRIFQTLTYKPQTNVSEIQIIDDQETIHRIEGSIEQGDNVSTSESGYGRGDPFASY
jgi:cell division septal protein FtsQ